MGFKQWCTPAQYFNMGFRGLDNTRTFGTGMQKIGRTLIILRTGARGLVKGLGALWGMSRMAFKMIKKLWNWGRSLGWVIKTVWRGIRKAGTLLKSTTTVLGFRERES